MADVEVWGARLDGGRLTELRVRFKGTGERTIDRATALTWLAGGHSLIAYGGVPHHPVRGRALCRVETGDEAWIRSDTAPEAADAVEFPHGH